MSATPTITIATTAFYDAWAATYDTDGNDLQRLDSAAFKNIKPLLFSVLQKPVRLLDLGCGTGRNTSKLRGMLPPGSTLYAVDGSEGMLAQARAGMPAEPSQVEVRWCSLDFTRQQADLAAFVGCAPVDAVISTLVLEHVMLDQFFAVVAKTLIVGGWAWVTGMHPDMGQSRAGFRRDDGVKVHGISYIHELEETIIAAKNAGLRLVGNVEERGVDDEFAVQELGERAKKWVGKRLHVGMLFERVL